MTSPGGLPGSLDRITLTGIEATGYHGVFEHERREGQPFIADVELGLDLRPASVSGDLAQSVDYGKLAVRVHDAIASDPVDLIETLAQRIAQVCLGYKAVQWVRVTVHKPHAPVAVAFTDVAVTIERSRM